MMATGALKLSIRTKGQTTTITTTKLYTIEEKLAVVLHYTIHYVHSVYM